MGAQDEMPGRGPGRLRLRYVVAAFLYLGFGFLWAPAGGFHLWELENRTTPHEHMDWFLEVQSAGRTPDGELVLCLYGRRSTCSHVQSVASSFSLTLPIDLLWHPRKDPRLRGIRTQSSRPRWLTVPRDRLGPACRTDAENLAPIEVVRLPETDPHEYFDGYSERELEKLTPPEGEPSAVFEIPMSFDGAEFHEMRQLVYVSAEPDASGAYYYDIETRPLTVADETPGYAAPLAFARDVLEFPLQILMLGGWTH